MTDEQKTTQEEPHDPFDGMAFAAMMMKMMGQRGCDCNCADMMMAMCGGAQASHETDAGAHEAARKTKEAQNG